MGKKSRTGTVPGKKSRRQWVVFALVVATTFLLCIAINFRALVEWNNRSAENDTLNTEIEKLKGDKESLKGEIQDLKNDSETVAREARKIGMSRADKKVSVPKS